MKKNQALFSPKNKSKKLKRRLLQFLFGALRVKSRKIISPCLFCSESRLRTCSLILFEQIGLQNMFHTCTMNPSSSIHGKQFYCFNPFLHVRGGIKKF